MNKIVLIIPYFGKLPNYFELFLYSFSKNDKVDFIIFSDQKINSNYKNVKINYMSFDELNKISKNKLNEIIYSPYKLCDFKPTYGKLFEDYIKQYEFWGYCDCDMIFGNLDLLLNKTISKGYQKILTDGHLTIFKNDKTINNLYKSNCKGIINFNEVVKIKEPCFFDEIMFPIICENNNIKTYINKEIYADILPQHFQFCMPQDNIENQKFKYEDGKVIRIDDNREYIYIHLQKRKMMLEKNLDYNNTLFIYPNIFTNDKNYIERKDKNYKIKYYIKYFKRLNFKRIIIKLKTNKLKRRAYES